MKRSISSAALLSAVIIAACADSTAPTATRTDWPAQPVIPPAPPAGGARGPDFIYVSNADGSGALRVARGDWPAWSPDAKRIAFQDSLGIGVMNADGSGLAHIIGGTQPAWSPDGTRLAYTNSEGIAVVNADGTGSKTLIRHDFLAYKPEDLGVGKPAWSPDGAKIAFEHLGDGGGFAPARIYVMNADGSYVYPLTSDQQGVLYAESDPAWSPDGSLIAFWSYGYGLAIVSAAGGVPTTLYKDFPRVCYGTKPSWSPDGKSIAFSYDPLSSDPSVWILSPKYNGLKELIAHGLDAVWSPDRSHIAYVAQ